MRRGLISLAFLFFVLAGCGGGDDGGGGGGSAATATATATAAADSPTATATTTATRTATTTATATIPPASTATATEAATATATPPDTATPTPTGTVTLTATATSTSTPTATPTSTPLPPEIVHFGVARANDVPQTTTLFDDEGRPVYVRLHGSGMTLFVEARHGDRGPSVGREAFDPAGGLPDLQMLFARDLGDGSTEVCDYDRFDPSMTGGVFAVESLDFSDDLLVADAANDIGCRVNDGTGVPQARVSGDACTQSVLLNGLYETFSPLAELQYCLQIASKWNFPPGDTVVATRVRDGRGALSDVEELVIRVLQTKPGTCIGLGERSFTIARPESKFLTSALAGADVSTDPWLEGPIQICAGPDVGDGLHPIRLMQDAIFGLKVLDGSTVCVQLSAEGSEGDLDCDGGSAVDIRVTHDLPNNPVRESGLGLDAGTGAATLSVPVAIVQLPVGSSVDDCATASFGNPFRLGMTTGSASATVGNTSQGGNATIAATGANFDCDGWTTTDGPGALVGSFTELGTVSGDTANALLLAD